MAPSEQSDVAKEAPFEKLKAATDALMDAGEMDVYGLTKEDLERGAALFQPAVGSPQAHNIVCAVVHCGALMHSVGMLANKSQGRGA